MIYNSNSIYCHLLLYVYVAAVGYDAYKLAPYGPIQSLLPYLTRRAQENRAIFAKAEKDRRLHYQALRAR